MSTERSALSGPLSPQEIESLGALDAYSYLENTYMRTREIVNGLLVRGRENPTDPIPSYWLRFLKGTTMPI